MCQLFIFWNKLGEIKVRGLTESLEFKESPEWEHIATIEPSVFIENVLNKFPQVVAKQLRGEK